MSDPDHEARHPADAAATPGTFESLGRKLDERPEVRAAEEALRQAQAQFEHAKAHYHEMREQAVADVHDARRRNTGDFLSTALELVRKYPGAGVVAALACGWFAGKIFRR
ncbi:MAG TPA: hypothetical protein VGN12_13130 [Pirellulales bacterium]|jgi:hypothetical protein